MTDMEDADQRAVTGHVKWFDPSKGFGFVVADEGGPDILLHANVLRNFGQSSLADGSGIEVVVQETSRGLQAAEVLAVTPPSTTTVGAGLADLEGHDPEEIAARPLEPARVKWFDKVKGFGFANVYGRSEDVFVHIEVLRQSGFADLAPGEAICMRVIEGRRGRLAAEVLGWDAGLCKASAG